MPVKSSNVESVAWAAGTMLVKFRSGQVYRYHDVPVATHKALMVAESVGAYLAKNVKHKFKTDKLTAEQLPDVLGSGEDDAESAT